MDEAAPNSNDTEEEFSGTESLDEETQSKLVALPFSKVPFIRKRVISNRMEQMTMLD